MDNKKINNLRKRFGRTAYKRALIKENDKILIGFSGGKDSFALIDFLADRKKYLPFNFDIVAAHIHINNIGYQSDRRYLEDVCKDRNVPFYYEEIEMEVPENKKKSMCFYCAWNRRKCLFELTHKYKCNKLALGHHMDDAVETLLMNQIFHASISSIPYKFSMFENRIEVIRPLLDLRDYEIKKYTEALNYQQQLKDCPYTNTKREKIRKLICDMEKMNSVAVKNVFRSPHKVFPEYLPQK